MLPWLLASLVLVLLLPRWGVIVHIALLVAAMLLDQTRMQPECISLALLMVASLETPGAKLIGRSHLIAIWFFAGLHKLLSTGYYHHTVPFLAVGLMKPSNAIVFEILGGRVCRCRDGDGRCWPSSRARAGCGRPAGLRRACVEHALAGLWLGWNKSVWPWNIALVSAALLLIWPWQTTFRDDWRDSSRLAKLAVLVILISPLGFYFGVVDGLLGHCLYSGNDAKCEDRFSRRSRGSSRHDRIVAERAVAAGRCGCTKSISTSRRAGRIARHPRPALVGSHPRRRISRNLQAARASLGETAPAVTGPSAHRLDCGRLVLRHTASDRPGRRVRGPSAVARRSFGRCRCLP